MPTMGAMAHPKETVVSRKVCRQPAYLLFFIPAVPIPTLGNPKALFLYDKTNSIVQK